MLDAPPHAAAVRPTVHGRQHVEQRGSRHARPQRGIAGGEPVGPSVLPHHVEGGARPVEHDAGRRPRSCPWLRTARGGASPPPGRHRRAPCVRLTCTNAVRGSGAPMPSTIADESWLKTYVVDVRLMAAARMRSTGCARNGSRPSHASASTYTPRRRRTSLRRGPGDRRRWRSRPTFAAGARLMRPCCERHEGRRPAGTCRPTVEATTDAGAPSGPLPVDSGAQAAAVDGLLARPPPL